MYPVTASWSLQHLQGAHYMTDTIILRMRMKGGGILYVLRVKISVSCTLCDAVAPTERESLSTIDD